MPNIDFPTSPALNDTYSFGDKNWIFNGTGWVLIAAPGPAGPSGFSGYSGTAGAASASGFSGYSGDGTSGYSGTSGFSGYSGKSGYSGISGFSGYSGSVPAGTATLTGTETLTNKTITAMKETKTAPAISAGVLTLDLNTASMFAVSLNAAITSFTVTNIPATGTFYGFMLEFTADGTARAITWTFQAVTVKWASGTAPTLTSTNGKKDTFAFYTWDAGTTWIGAIVGQNY